MHLLFELVEHLLLVFAENLADLAIGFMNAACFCALRCSSDKPLVLLSLPPRVVHLLQNGSHPVLLLGA